MASWKLIVEDYGKIKSAEIEVAPFTLFVGDNNSGKSYMLALLWGIENFGITSLIGNRYVNMEEANVIKDWFCEQIDTAVEKKKFEVSIKEISETIPRFLNERLKKTKSNLVKRIFNSESVDIGKFEIHLEDLEQEFLKFEILEDSNMLRIYFDDKKYYILGGEIIEEQMYKDDKFIQWFLIESLYGFILDVDINESQKNNCVYLPAARTGFVLTKDIINKVGRKNTFNLSEEKETITPFIRPINQFLDILGDLSVENIGSKKNLKLVADLEKQMTNGVVEISSMPNKEVQYVPIGHRKGIPLRLSSAVVTELSPLILILKHKEEIKGFYYEEPEMCLHPQLQNKMGMIMGRIVNSGIRMVITTHSDIILQHINNMIKLANREDCEEICKKLGYGKIDLLSDSQVKVYQLRAKTIGKTEIEELPCGKNGFVIPTFNDALDKIMEEAYEIQG